MRDVNIEIKQDNDSRLVVNTDMIGEDVIRIIIENKIRNLYSKRRNTNDKFTEKKI